MKRVLITGANSYIGTSFEKYAVDNYASMLQVDTIDMIDDEWRKADFSKYDIVYHVAGIAHNYVGKVSEEVKQKYYAVNTYLAIETAKKAKREGVKQFVFMSSIIVYGDSAPYGKKKMITKDTIPQPSNFYGDSKWQADKGIRELADDNFMVTVIRPPMIYGKGSKGNYPTLSKMAKKMPIFPSVTNERSMLYIDNLCEFLCQVMAQNKGGVFWPQNSEYTRTAEMIQQIADVTGHKILMTKALNLAVLIVSKIPGKIGDLTNKAFGNMTYDKEMSQYDFQYQKVDFCASIKKTEGM
ncbi:MAG: NAD-dependent epimerase/dehydratase family protein [Lachnospiraceae bacterium]|nr:NAD-dependent epimerase/dehydratase family protein [Lachnospiraceae bacterium]